MSPLGATLAVMASSNPVAQTLVQLEADLAPVVVGYSRRRLRRTGWTSVNLACLTRPWGSGSPMVLARVLGTAVDMALPDDPGSDWDPAIRRGPASVIAWVHALLTTPDAVAPNFAHSMPPNQISAGLTTWMLTAPR